MFFESVPENFYHGHFWLTGRQIHSSRSYVFYVAMYLTLPSKLSLKKYTSKSNTLNNMKLMILTKIRVIRT
jgi:hypothetical protein